MADINEYLQIYLNVAFAVTGLSCLVQLFSYGIFKALGLMNILR